MRFKLKCINDYTLKARIRNAPMHRYLKT